MPLIQVGQPVLAFKGLGDVLDQLVVPIFTAQVMVAVSGADLDVLTFNIDQCDVKCATAKNQDARILSAITKAVRERRSGRLVD